MITQRASSCGIVDANPSRIAWSSAPRLPGLEIVRRPTPGAGSSTSSRPLSAPGRPLLEDNERVALGYRLPLLAEDLLDNAGILSLHRHLHLHRLKNHHRVALGDIVAELDFDLPHRAR